MNVRNFKHGYSETKLYSSWHHMIYRCTNPNDKNWKDYGDRGITVCKEWNDFLIFRFQMRKKFFDAKNRYKGELISIERIDNNEGYNYKNCIFISHKLQNKNRRTVNPCKAINRKTRKEVYGESQTELAKKLNLTQAMIHLVIKGKSYSKYWIIRPLLKNPQ